MKSTRVRIGDRTLSLGNLDKVFYPETGTTKAEVIDYYRQIAPFIIPHLRDRAVTLKRYPDGVQGEHFYEKRCPSHRPEWVRTEEVTSIEKKVNSCLINDEPTLIWAANLAAIELHPLLSTKRNFDRPTQVVFDLDPGPPATILDCAEVALELVDVFKRMKLEAFVKSSGGKGLHVHVPLNTGVSFDETKDFARTLAEEFQKQQPGRVTSVMKKENRKGKVFIDWSQNDSVKTTVCVYSLRAREHPTVAVPVAVVELSDAVKKKDPDRLVFEYRSAIKRVNKLGDLFEPLLKLKQKLP